MATNDDRRTGSEHDATTRDLPLSDEVVRDLAMREALGLLDEDESALFETVFESMTPDDQAAVLDLQSAVAREIAGGGTDEPDRALRYKVLARLTEEMSSDLSVAGPIATIGTASRIGSRPRSASFRFDDERISELRFDRVRRSAAVWRAASFALAAAGIALFGLLFRAQSVSDHLLDQRSSEIIAERFGGLFGDEVDIRRLLASTTAVVTPLVASSTDAAAADGASILLREKDSTTAGLMPAALLGFQFPPETRRVEVVAVRLDGGGERSLGAFDVTGRTFAALPLELGGIPLANVRLEVRDQASGTVIFRTVDIA